MNLIAYLILLILIPTILLASVKSILVQSTTSTKNSGFYDFILPLFTADSGIKVNVVAVGTGAAIKNARNCDGDVLLVHSPEDEQKFIADGFSTKRHNIMHNNFVIVGPVADPAGIVGMQDVGLAFAKIATSGAKFASRSDSSGTHTKELSIWKKIGLDPVNSYRFSANPACFGWRTLAGKAVKHRRLAIHDFEVMILAAFRRLK